MNNSTNTNQFTAKDMAVAIALNSFMNGFETKEGIKSADISTFPNQEGLSKITVTLESGQQFVIEVHAI